MPEIANVISGNTITSTWGNQIRDRTVQRYASVAARSASIPSPTEGDLSWLQDSNSFDVYNGTAWVPVAATSEVDGSTEVAGPVNLTTTMAAVATVSLTIPTGWATWKCMAFATFASINENLSNQFQMQIDGTNQQLNSISQDLYGQYAALGGRRTGMTTTGARSVSLMAKEVSGTGTTSQIFLYAKANRTS